MDQDVLPCKQDAPAAPSKQDVEKAGKLRKKLREIEELERRQTEDGAILKANQKEKVAQKETILAELAALGAGGQSTAPCCTKQGG